MGRDPLSRRQVAQALARAGFPYAGDDAAVLWRASGGDHEVLDGWLERRLRGEPLSWVVGSTDFAGERLVVEPGVYVPRPQTEPLALRAAELLPERGVALDVATGSGAVAVVLGRRRPSARVVATDIDPAACRCARRNGVEVYQGDLAEPVPAPLWGRFDVVFAVLPYVPTEELEFLPGDVLRHEPRRALDGGKGGLHFLAQLMASALWLVKEGGSIIVELGGGQDQALAPALVQAGLQVVERFVDGDGDLRGLELRNGAGRTGRARISS